MKRILRIMLPALVVLLLPCVAIAGGDDLLQADEGWAYVGYTYGGVTFPVPADYVDFGVDATDQTQGYVLIGGSTDFTLQMRVVQPEQMTYEQFKARTQEEPTADWHTRMDGEREILIYRNMVPSGQSELYGIAMTGLDGLLYKISIFTGIDEDFSSDAPVWQIAETIGAHVRHQDFSEWGIEDAPSFGEGESLPSLENWLKGLLQG